MNDLMLKENTTYFVLRNIFGAQHRHLCKFSYHGSLQFDSVFSIPTISVRSPIYWLRQREQSVTKVRTLCVMVTGHLRR